MQIFCSAARVLFPDCRCLVCGEPRHIHPGDALCGSCAHSLAGHAIPTYACPLCLSPMRAGEPCHYCVSGGMNGLVSAHAPFYYGGAVQRLIVLCKFGPVEIAANPLAAAMTDCLGTARPDALVPVPLHHERLRERGFNQAALLCDLVSLGTGVPVLHALTRIRKTRRQSSLPPEAREDNVRDAFDAVAPVTGMRLMLVDDVRTTGSTVRACAKTLMAAGAMEVRLLTAAVAPQRNLPKGE